LQFHNFGSDLFGLGDQHGWENKREEKNQAPRCPYSKALCSTGHRDAIWRRCLYRDVGGRSFLSRMPEVLLEDLRVPCCMRIDIGGRIGACCIAGIADNDTFKVIIARARILSRGEEVYFSELQIIT